MKLAARLSAAASAGTFALLFLGQCRRQDVALSDATPSAAAGPRVVVEPPQAPPPVAVEATDSGSPPPSEGVWLEGNIYRFLPEGVRQCAAPAAPGSARIGAVVRVTSKIDELFVAPRDFKLESGGVILDSAVVEKAPAGCAPLLAPKSLRAGKTAAGVVVFDLPPGFNPEHRPVRITYQPTRWGGARRVEAVLCSPSQRRHKRAPHCIPPGEDQGPLAF